MRKLWSEGEHDTGYGHNAAETIIDTADDEEVWAITFTDGRVFRKRGSITEEGKMFVPTGAQAFESVRAAWPDGSDSEVVDVCVDEFMHMQPAELEEPGAQPPRARCRAGGRCARGREACHERFLRALMLVSQEHL